MSEDQHALPGTGDGVACVIDLLNVLMRSLEERLAPPPPPPRLLARIRRLVTGKIVVDQCRRAVCALMRARLGQVASGLAAAVAADLEAAETDGGSSDGGAVPPAFDAPDLETACNADGAAPGEVEPDPSAMIDQTAIIEASACDGLVPDTGTTVRPSAFLQLLRAGVSLDALGGGEAAPVPALPSALPERAFVPTSILLAPGSTVVLLSAWTHSLPRRVRWQEARGPDDPRRAAFRNGGNQSTYA